MACAIPLLLMKQLILGKRQKQLNATTEPQCLHPVGEVTRSIIPFCRGIMAGYLQCLVYSL